MTTLTETETSPGRQRTSEHIQSAGIWAILAVASTMLAGLLAGTPPIMLTPLAVLAAGLGIIGYLDSRTYRIRNKHTLMLAGAVTLSIIAVQLMFPSEAVLLNAVIGAVVTFGFFYGLAFAGGFVGGGDIKLSPVIGGLLTILNPIAAFVWVTLTLLSAGFGMVLVKLIRPDEKRTAMGPYMLIALPLTLLVVGMLASSEYIPQLLNIS